MLDLGKIDWTPYLERLKRMPPRKRGRLRPYVAFGFIGQEWSGKEPFPVERFSVLPMDGNHGQKIKIEQYVLKGHKIVGWWFPETLSREEKLRFDYEPGDPNPYDKLAAYCKRLQNSDPDAMLALKEERDALARKVAELSEGKRKA